ncbi:MAG TPA: GNAT family N-acetyltransferase [Baekduia sp.]|nr:GNAT family N-acetyltransferase [Baekduia sp.]
MDDAELARRSIRGFGEMVAALGGDGAVRRPDAIGANVGAAADNHWLDAAVVPLDATPPPDDPQLPHSLWTVAGAAPGRTEAVGIAMPCLGLVLDDPALDLGAGAGGVEVEVPPLAVVGAVNDRAYGQADQLEPLLAALRDDRIRTHGLRLDGELACVTLTLAVGDDVSVQYVATEQRHRRQGLASRLLLAILAAQRERGMRTATLQASPDGLPVYERLGFRRVATLRAFLRSA